MSVRVSPLSKGADSPSGERGDLRTADAPQARGGISVCLLVLVSGMIAGCGETVRLLVNGPDAVAKAVCEQMAGDLVKTGTAAVCVAPGVKR